MRCPRAIGFRLSSLLLLALAFLPAAESRAAGHLKSSGGRGWIPLESQHVEAVVRGGLARTTVRQVFANPTRIPMNATYLFPLNKDAAVHAMQMQVGDMLVEAVIAKREAARQTFETAKKAGKAAALLEQHRPNMFTQKIANLMPGMPVTITLTYSQAVPRVWRLRIAGAAGRRPALHPASDGDTGRDG